MHLLPGTCCDPSLCLGPQFHMPRSASASGFTLQVTSPVRAPHNLKVHPTPPHPVPLTPFPVTLVSPAPGICMNRTFSSHMCGHPCSSPPGALGTELCFRHPSRIRGSAPSQPMSPSLDASGPSPPTSWANAALTQAVAPRRASGAKKPGHRHFRCCRRWPHHILHRDSTGETQLCTQGPGS